MHVVSLKKDDDVLDVRDESTESRTSGHDRISMTSILAILAHGSVTKQRNAESLHQWVSDRLGTTT
jgi:hypothetical protein